MRRINWPIALAVLFVAQLAWLLFYTEHLLRALQDNAEGISRIYAEVSAVVGDPNPRDVEETLFVLQDIVVESGVPIVVTAPGGAVTAVRNLPFEVDLDNPDDQARLREFVRELDLLHLPQGDSTVNLIHFGDPPEARGLRWIPYLQAGGLLLTAVLSLLTIQAQRRAEGEKAWTAMARELAHQLGTPISSLQGWLELLRLPAHELPEGLREGEITEEIEADLTRLERISHRFERIGREPVLRKVEISVVLGSLQQYLEARLPRLSSGVELLLDVQGDLPPIMGNEVLLTWALENVVNNALDALGGKGGMIRIRARSADGGRVVMSISDTGPGVDPEIRDEIFEPGVTSKPRGWGVGLALSRRIIQVVHKGRIELGEEGGAGATFNIRFPAAPAGS